VNQPGALIADFGRDWFDIVIVAGGLPVTLHSVSPKGGFREFEDTLGQMDEEIRRTVDFFNLTHKDNFIPPAEAVVLSGIRKNNGVERALVEKYFPLVSPSPDGRLVYPEGFIPDEYAVLLGLILKPQTAIGFKKAGQAVYQDINLNLLSGRSRIQRKSLSVKQLMVPVSIVLAVIILVPLFLMHNSGLAENRSLQTQLEQVNRELKVRRLALVQSDISETQIAKYLSDSKSIQDQRNLLSGQGDLAGQVDSILKGLSANLRYTGIVSTATQIVLDGLADSRVDVLNYTSYLESQNLFPEVRIAAIEDVAAAGEGGTIISGQVSFTIILERQVNE
jgi:Tfp pilus assembly protein PilN